MTSLSAELLQEAIAGAQEEQAQVRRLAQELFYAGDLEANPTQQRLALAQARLQSFRKSMALPKDIHVKLEEYALDPEAESEAGWRSRWDRFVEELNYRQKVKALNRAHLNVPQIATLLQTEEERPEYGTLSQQRKYEVLLEAIRRANTTRC